MGTLKIIQSWGVISDSQLSVLGVEHTDSDFYSCRLLLETECGTCTLKLTSDTSDGVLKDVASEILADIDFDFEDELYTVQVAASIRELHTKRYRECGVNPRVKLAAERR